jgi:concentrative nucleoside transporter, CNT family
LFRKKVTASSFQTGRTGLLLFVFLFLYITTGFSKDKIKNADLTKYWVTQSVNGGKVTNDSTVSNALILLDKGGDRFFDWIENTDTISGEWSLAKDTLTLVLDFQPTLDAIDSTAYVVENGQPKIRFYKAGNLITTLTDEGFKSMHIVRVLIIKQMNDEQLKLLDTVNGSVYLFKPKSVKLAGHITFNDIVRGIFGMIVLLLITYLLSSNKRAIDWRLVGSGILIQIVFAILVLKVGIVREAFAFVAGFFVLVMDFTYQGSSFLFGSLMDVNTYGFIFAFQVLPTIIFFSALSSILYYLGILQKIVFGLAWVMSKTMRLSGAESLAAAANIFIGQTEAPLVVKPYLENMSKSEILCLMVGGMATIAGGVFAAYVGFLGGNDPEQMQFFATHLLTASIMSAPAAIVAAKILYPEVDPDKVDRTINIPREKIGSNFLDAISNGTTDGLKLAINVGVMLLTFTALIYMVNHIMLWFGDLVQLNPLIVDSTDGQFSGLSLDYLLGLMFYPIAWVIGVPSQDALLVGQLLGKKTVVNEFIAYQSMEELKEAGMFLSNKSIIISTYALCGFANFASIGIQIGGIGAIAPGQRKTLAAFGIKALIGGTIAAFLTAVIAGTIV